MYRIVKEEDDLKLASETDKNLADMGFELTLDAVRRLPVTHTGTILAAFTRRYAR